MPYTSMLIQVLTCPTSFHQLYSMMKSAILTELTRNANNAAMRTTFMALWVVGTLEGIACTQPPVSYRNLVYTTSALRV
jgi:hypothetical protein